MEQSVDTPNYLDNEVRHSVEPNLDPLSGPRISAFKDLYDAICARIRSSGILDDIMKDFEALKNDYQRVEYTMRLQEINQLEIKRQHCEQNEEAARLEKEYDDLIDLDQMAPEASRQISQSLKLTLPSETVSLAVRYLKRGWASLVMENFDDAKIDANRCLKFGIDSPTFWKAYEILGHCHAKEGAFRTAEGYFQNSLAALRVSDAQKEVKAEAARRISLVFRNIKGVKNKKKNKRRHLEDVSLPKVAHGPHPWLESATKAVRVILDSTKGRSIYASRDLKPGDVIMAEGPFAASVSSECLESHCCECFGRLPKSCIPCGGCSQVWFCNEKCRDFEDSLHNLECGILHLLHHDCLGKMAPLVYRILTKETWTRLKGRKPELLKLLKAEETGRPFLWPSKSKYFSDDFDTVIHLCTKDDRRSFGDLFKRSLMSLFIVCCLREMNFFDLDVENLIYIASLTLRLLQATSCNAYEISELVTNIDDPRVSSIIEVGGAVYPTISLTNHSCWPNAARYSVGKWCILRATRSIQKDKEVYDNYGCHFVSMTLNERQELLKAQYKFTCECDACKNDWPVYPHHRHPVTFRCPEPTCKHPTSFVDSCEHGCTVCGQMRGYKALNEQIGNRLSTFARLLRLVRDGEPHKALNPLLEHQAFFDRHFIPPGKVLSDSQKAITQCFSAMGNTYRSNFTK